MSLLSGSLDVMTLKINGSYTTGPSDSPAQSVFTVALAPP